MQYFCSQTGNYFPERTGLKVGRWNSMSWLALKSKPCCQFFSEKRHMLMGMSQGQYGSLACTRNRLSARLRPYSVGSSQRSPDSLTGSCLSQGKRHKENGENGEREGGNKGEKEGREGGGQTTFSLSPHMIVNKLNILQLQVYLSAIHCVTYCN